MNIFLIPYTNWRHLSMGLFVGSATALAWWTVLNWIVFLGPLLHGTGLYWSQSFEGLIFIASIAATAGGASVLGEGSLRRRELKWRLATAACAFVVTFALAATSYLATSALITNLATVTHEHLTTDPSVVTLRYTVPTWAAAGAMSGLGPWLVRKFHRLIARTFGIGVDGTQRPRATTWPDRFQSLFHHTGGGAVGALTGAIVWHIFGLYPEIAGDLYMGAAFGATTWGFVHGVLAWPIPDDLYAGWVRILSAERYGLRIPIDHENGEPAERFIGHFPHGLDLYAPADQGVAELHTSFVVDDEHNYSVRGLTVMPTTVSRFMEKIRLDYDPNRPSPLEAELEMGDRIRMGEGAASSEVEFLLLPKEEM